MVPDPRTSRMKAFLLDLDYRQIREIIVLTFGNFLKPEVTLRNVRQRLSVILSVRVHSIKLFWRIHEIFVELNADLH